MKKLKRSTWIVILIISVAVVAVGSFFLIRYLTEKDTTGDLSSTEKRATSDSTVIVVYPTDAPTQKPTESGPKKAFDQTLAELGDFTVSFDELSEINTDVYAWIYIPNTNVDYPVAQSTEDGDDSFYLSHNVYRQYQFSGTIYSEVQNSTDFHDRVTVLYGHNMLNGSMFASLHNFEDPEFFEKNNTIFILTRRRVYTYLVYSAYTYDDRHILNSMNMKDDKVFKDYIDSTLHPYSYNGLVRDGVTLNMSSKILTLSTCTGGASNTRFLVQGVLVDEQDRW